MTKNELLRGELLLIRIGHHCWRGWRQALKRDDMQDALAFDAARNLCEDLHVEIKKEIKAQSRQERLELKQAA